MARRPDSTRDATISPPEVDLTTGAPGLGAGGWIHGLRRHLARVQLELDRLSPEAGRALLAAIESVQTTFAGRRAGAGEPYAPGTSTPGVDGARILVVGTDGERLTDLFQTLEGGSWPVLTLAQSVETGLLRLSRDDFDVMLLAPADVDAGLRYLEGVKHRAVSPPTILTIRRGDERLAAEAFRAGVRDYLSGSDLTAERLRVAVARAIQQHELERQLESAHAQLAELVHRDPLTGLHNRRYFETRLAIEFARARRFDESLALVLLDIDHFKSINDRQGHPFGDRVLVRLGRLLSESLRQIDLAARLGGDEFALILPNTSLRGAGHLAERIIDRVRRRHPDTSDPEAKFTVSAGVTSFPECHAEGRRSLLECADRALYRAKDEGRDRVCIATSS